MPFQKCPSFYEGVIHCTAAQIRKRDKQCTMVSMYKSAMYKGAELYVDTTEKIIALFKEDKNHCWDLQSIQQKLGFTPHLHSPGINLNDEEIQFLLDTLVNFRYIDVTDKYHCILCRREESLHYMLPGDYRYPGYYQPESWFEANLHLFILAFFACLFGISYIGIWFTVYLMIFLTSVYPMI